MKESVDSTLEWKALVHQGYDRCAESYAVARGRDDGEQLTPLFRVLGDQASILDLGCGAGVPIAQALARRHGVTGIDSSAKMIELAKNAVPEARFFQGDILEIELERNGFDAVVAIFVLFHIPREEHKRVFERVWSWLKPGGHFLVSVSGEAEAPYAEADFFGTRMYWSNLGYMEYREHLSDLGFAIVEERIIGHGYGRSKIARDERHPMILAQKPLT